MNELENIKKLMDLIGSEGYRDGSSTKKGWIYHPIPFPEFTIPTHKSSTVDEFDCIRKDFGSFSGVNALDIGCANGYFSFNIAIGGAQNVVGFEGDKFVCDVNEAIRSYKKIENVKFINKYFDEKDLDQFGEFDIVIMLNIHMWIHKQIGAVATKKLMEKLCQKSKMVYFQTAHKGGGGGYQVPEFTKEKHIRIYLEEVGFKSVKCINQNMDWFKRFMFRCSNV